MMLIRASQVACILVPTENVSREMFSATEKMTVEMGQMNHMSTVEEWL